FKPRTSSILSPQKVEGRSLKIMNATKGNGKYGETLNLDVTFIDSGEQVQIRCSLQNREGLFDDLQAQLFTAEDDGIGPFAFQTIAGGKFYHLLPVKEEDVSTADTEDSTDEDVEKEDSTDEEGVPF